MVKKIGQAIYGVKKNIQEMRPYQTARPLGTLKTQCGHGPFVNLASNENPFTSSLVNKRVFEEAIIDIRRYPDPTGTKLRTVIAERLNIAKENISLSNGSSEAIALLIQAYAGPGDDVIISSVAYAFYDTCIQIQGANAIKINDVNWVHDLLAMQQAITPATKMIIMANPNNPTGTYVTHADLKQFVTAIPDNILLVIDEAYYEYIMQSDYPDCLALQKNHDNLVITRSFSKIYGLAGLRVGYCLAHEQITSILNCIRLPFNLNTIGVAAAAMVFNETSYIERTATFIKVETDKILDQLNQWGINYVHPSANFIMIEFKDHADDMFNFLLQEGILTRQLNNYNLPDHLRVSIGTSEENNYFINALEKAGNKVLNKP